MFNLGLDHYHFAEGTDSSDWRHKKSRLYYAAYNVARSIRLHYDGVYSTDSEDHKKVGNLPNDFPNLAKYQNDLPILRDDRNKCDYDHVASEQDLFIGIDDTVTLVEEFIQDSRDYLKTKGNIIL
ncbi:MAG TPA: hypothetical protein DEB39_05245 [Planctomycetaceae bacterium]|nr:hypothetical protein [Planctomycetaceae bacterium]